MTWWSPKPLRPDAENPLFKSHERPVVVKGLNPWQRQRLADGTPPTVPGPTGLRPPDPPLYIREELSKGSLVEKYADKTKPPKLDPQDPISVVKSYLAQKDPDQKEFIKKSQDSTERMANALKTLAKACGAEMKEDSEDEEKSIAGLTGKPKGAGEKAGAATAGIVGGIARTVLGSVPKK